MGRGFFAGSTLVEKAPLSLIPKCGACGLSKRCNSPKMPINGEGRRRILIVGEAPGKEEDQRGIPFCDKSGVLLENVLKKFGVKLRRDCWITNAIICRPKNNETPNDKEVSYCQPNIIKAIEELKPYVIIPLGGIAVKSVLGYIWKESPGSMSRWAGWDIPCQEPNTWICPTFHPSFILRSDKEKVQRMYWEQHLERAVSHEEAPWEELPDYKKMIDIVFDPKEAARYIRKIIQKGGRTAFDYETNMLKPDSPERRIVTCSICWKGKKTIAFPFQGEAVKAFREYLQSDLPKIASNLKFEDRWSNAALNEPVNNWEWDTMQTAHNIDNRPEITGLKFQSFTLLGKMAYDDHLKKFLQAKSPRESNKILQEIDMRDLLFYNGLDSLLEYQVALKQMKMMSYPKL